MRGFTLVELIMTLVIIGMLAVVVGPRFFSRQPFDERLFYEESLSAVRYAQKLALASGCPVRAQINSSGYSLTYAAACGTATSGTVLSNPAGGTFSSAPPGTVTVQAALDVTFNSLGCVNAAGACATGSTVAQVGGFSMTVYGSTGFVDSAL